MRIQQNIMAVGVCGGMLLLVSADKEDAKAAVVEFDPEMEVADFTVGELYDTVQRPLKFNEFTPLEPAASENFLLVLDQHLTAEDVKKLNEHLAV